MDIPQLEVDGVINTYDKIAGAFSNTRPNTWDWIQKYIKSFPFNSHILDIGCGNGRNMTNYNSEQNLHFKGIDSCQKFIDIAIKNGKDVQLGDMCNLPYNKDSFDGIISIASFHHLATPERRKKCLIDMMRVLKHKGKILMSVWSINQMETSKFHNVFHYGDNIVPWKNKYGDILGERYYYIFHKDELKTLILETGFTILDWTYFYGNEIIIMEKK